MKKYFSILFAIILSVTCIISFVACNKNGQTVSTKDLGTYYKVDGTDLDPDSFIELKSGNKWYDGEFEGKFTIKDGKITLYDGDDELMSGTVSDGVLTLNFMGMETVYKKSSTSIGSDKVDSSAMIKSIDGGQVDGLNVSLEIGDTVEDVDLSGMITTSKDCSWQLFLSRSATAADAIATKIIVPKKGVNTYYIVVTSADNKTNRTYTLNVWKNYYATLSFYANDRLYTTEEVLTHTTYGEGPSCSVAGYNFNGWGCEGYYVVEDKIFNAKLTAKNYKVVYDVNGGDDSLEDGIATFDEDFSLPTPRKTGYIFMGWTYDGNTYENVLHYSFTTDIKLTAKWAIRSYKVVVRSNDETRGTVNKSEQQKEYNSTINLSATTKTGYIFAGWYETSYYGGGDKKISDQLNCTATIPAFDVRYVAKWSKNIAERNNPSAGRVSSLTSTYKVGDELAFTATTNSGYVWTGWFDGDTKLTDNEKLVVKATAQDKAYTAKWVVREEMSDFSFESGTNWCKITGLKNKNATEIVIPNSVTSIADSAFEGCTGLISVTIGNSVTSIGNYACKGCTGLTSVTIPDSVTSIHAYVFQGCNSLTSITIPSSVRSIGNQAFAYCTGLTSIIIPNSVRSIGYSAFSGCIRLTSVYISNIAQLCCIDFKDDDSNPLYYARNLYLNNKLITELNIPDSVTSIGNYAFIRCTGLTSITIPNSVTSIGDGAFNGCIGLTSITIPNSVTSIGNYAFAYCTGLTSVTIPDSVTSIGGSAFSGCTGLTSVTIPNSVTTIGNYAFSSCDSLIEVYNKSSLYIFAGSSNYGNVGYYAKNVYKQEGGSKLSTDENGYIIYTNGEEKLLVKYAGKDTELTLPNEITAIHNNAFSGCTGLTSVTIPDSVRSIGYSAFNGCIGLTYITIPNGVTSIGNYAFYGCYSLIEVYNKSSLNIEAGGSSYGYVGNYAKNVYNQEGGSKLSTDENGYVIYTNGEEKLLVKYAGKDTELTLPNGITSIHDHAFAGCIGLTSITIGSGVISIGGSAFSGCTGLTSITIPNGVTSIGSKTFYGCTGLTSITIPNSVTSIGEGAFNGCIGLTSVTIPDSVTSIGDSAFYQCTGLTSVTIPDSVTSIGEGAFYSCTRFTSINFNGTKAQWQSIKKDSYWNYGVPSTCKVICTDGTVSI